MNEENTCEDCKHEHVCRFIYSGNNCYAEFCKHFYEKETPESYKENPEAEEQTK